MTHFRLASVICSLLAIPAAAQPNTEARPRSAAVVNALDSNHDGTIDADEIAQATAHLRTLDQNGDGQLTRNEYRGNPTNSTSQSNQTNATTPPRTTAPPTAPNLTKRTAAATTANHPNVIVMIADDLGWNGLGIHNPKMTTPHLDRLAAEGLELQRFYVYPVCSPTRAAFLTGNIPLRYGIADALGPQQAGIPNQTPTLPAIFQSAGYATSLLGKWHLGRDNPPMQCGFDHFYGFLGSEIDYFTHSNPRSGADWQRDGKDLQESGYATDLIANEAVRQLQQRDKTRPFFMEISFNAPHVPLSAPDDLIAKHQSGGGLYAAVIDAMDAGIGRILTTLDEQGLRDNTFVVFFSDNGAARRYSDNAPFSNGKDTINEGGIRTPCIMRWPHLIPTAAKSQQPFSVHDFLPTLTAAAGLSPHQLTIDGSNQWPAIRSGKTQPRPAFVIASHDTAMIDGDWKLITWDAGGSSLYHLTNDPSESQDLSKTQADLTRTMTAKLAELKKGVPAAPTRNGLGPGGRGGKPGGPAAGGNNVKIR